MNKMSLFSIINATNRIKNTLICIHIRTYIYLKHMCIWNKHICTHKNNGRVTQMHGNLDMWIYKSRRHALIWAKIFTRPLAWTHFNTSTQIHVHTLTYSRRTFAHVYEHASHLHIYIMVYIPKIMQHTHLLTYLLHSNKHYKTNNFTIIFLGPTPHDPSYIFYALFVSSHDTILGEHVIDYLPLWGTLTYCSISLFV